MKNHLRELGVEIPKIMLPNKTVNMEKWSVVACDQYTSQPEYWSAVANFVGNSSSTLKMILPEIYLGDNNDSRIENINRTMKQYIDGNVLVSQDSGFILVERKTSNCPSRKGLILALDLEKYDYSEDSQTLIRATEGTVLDRLPPRVKIRENALLEIPHITILIDDPGKTVIEPLFKKVSTFEKLYDFDLMMEGGHIRGYLVDDIESVSSVFGALDKLIDKDVFKSRYGAGEDKEILLFAVGDGNHSLAAAKVCWENIKKTLSDCEKSEHPARYALVEVQNIHDDFLNFEPIFRVAFNIDEKDMLNALEDFFKNKPVLYSEKSSVEDAAAELRKDKNIHVISFVMCERYGIIVNNNPKSTLEVASLQAFLDEYQKSHTDIEIDYIHGRDVLESLGEKKGNIGFYTLPLDKKDLFKTIIKDGILPRKTFSMGEASEKRFYLECRQIKT
ncbi:MAG: DUF1015 domain-containing protein [Clostridia bacterium]|jgi:hypothetical protein